MCLSRRFQFFSARRLRQAVRIRRRDFPEKRFVFYPRDTANLSLNTIVNVEVGNNPNPTIETVKKIAKALEIGVDDLIK